MRDPDAASHRPNFREDLFSATRLMEEGACDGWGCRAAATGTGGAFRVVLRGDSMRAPWSWSCGPVSYETNLATHPATHKGNWPGRTIPVGRRAAFSLSPVPTPRGSPRCRGRRCRAPPPLARVVVIDLDHPVDHLV